MSANTYTKGYLDGTSLTEAQLDTAYQTLQLDVANTALMTTGSASGQALISNGSGIAASFQTLSDPLGPFALRNYGLKATVATGVMTISLKTKALATPSGTDIVDFTYSTNGTTSASYNAVQVTAATTFTLNASATLGASSTATLRIYAYGYYNTVTASVKLAVSSRPDFDRGAGILTTLVSASADSAAVLYASAALTIVPRLLGWIEAAHNSSGAWQTPTKINITNLPPTSPFELNRAVSTIAGRIGAITMSASSGSFSTSSTTATSVTNLSVTLTTTGRPVKIECVSDASGTIQLTQFSNNSSAQKTRAQIFRGSSSLGVFDSIPAQTLPTTVVQTLDPVVAGTYTYSIKIQSINSGTSNFAFTKLIAYEI